MERLNTIDVILSSIKDNLKKTDLSQSMPLECLFNDLNGNEASMVYPMESLRDDGSIIFPSSTCDSDDRVTIKKQVESIVSSFDSITSLNEVDAVLDQLEKQLLYISNSLSDYKVVSLFDYISLRAGIDVINSVYPSSDMLFLSMDISGIQNFIYHLYDNGDVLKNLRARSFYLELMLENAVDELLRRVNLCRTNLVYSGGGHAYLLLPNTEETKEIIAAFDDELNTWLRNNYGIDLYVALGYTCCTENDLLNNPVGSYNRVFQDVSHAVSTKKRRRYSYNQIIELNSKLCDNTRECKLCHSSFSHSLLDGKGLCVNCQGLSKLSSLMFKHNHFYILKKSIKETNGCIDIFPGTELVVGDDAEFDNISQCDRYLRVYVKNTVSTKGKCLYLGDYSLDNKHTIQDYVDKSVGIKRMGVVRGDVDNLGAAFVSGFPKEKQNILRAIAFSRSMSMFFKFYINEILECEKRKVAIVYSGGDDVFILGAWNDVLESIRDITDALKRYSLGTLTVSAGFGLFDEKYPIYYVADAVGELESESKHAPGKNSLTLFTRGTENHTYTWEQFNKAVYEDKYLEIERFIKSKEQHGMSFVYNMLDLIKSSDERLNIARFAYLISRMSPQDDRKDIEKHNYYIQYKDFSQKIYSWILDKEARRELITALYLFVYMNRKITREV